MHNANANHLPYAIVLQVATASIEDMRDLSRAPLTLLASLISVSCLQLLCIQCDWYVSGGTASIHPHDSLLVKATLLHFVGPNCRDTHLMADCAC